MTPTPSPTTLRMPTPAGRVLEVLLEGPEDGFPLVYHHGTPQGAVPQPDLARAAGERGLRVGGWSRAGYGASMPREQPGRIADDITDVATILDHLGLDRFVTL